MYIYIDSDESHPSVQGFSRILPAVHRAWARMLTLSGSCEFVVEGGGYVCINIHTCKYCVIFARMLTLSGGCTCVCMCVCSYVCVCGRGRSEFV